MPTKIEWAEETWNPTVGCRRVSAGCRNCYAEQIARRGMSPQHRNLTDEKGRWNGRVSIVPHKLVEPLRWRRPRLVFVDSMSDLFYREIPAEFRRAVFGAMIAGRSDRPSAHTFQVLTKRTSMMQAFMGCEDADSCVDSFLQAASALLRPKEGAYFDLTWPPPNVWLGTSVEDQRSADERVSVLAQTPAHLRFLSCEPLLGPVKLRLKGIGWVIVGGESGHRARGCDVQWIEDVVEQCRRARIPCFVKQLGANVFDGGVAFSGGEVVDYPCAENALSFRDPKAGEMKMWPAALRVREMPA